MAYNIADFDSFIRSYIINSIKQRQPELDVSTNSAFDDLFIKPAIEMLTPILQNLRDLEFKMNLNNATYMSEEDLDEIGLGNYLVERNQGSKASTVVTCSFSRVPTASNLVFSVGTTFATDAGLRYQTTQDYTFTPTECLTKYNPSRMSYDFDLAVEAIDVGSDYNVSENQIKSTITNLGANLISVTNKVAVIDGTDLESNEDYAARIKQFYISQHLGTKPGYREFILENFSEVEDLYIAGYKDSEMERDVLTVVQNGSTTTTHYGGKVDFYIKGSLYESNSASLTINSPKLKLSQGYSTIDDVSGVVVVNETNTLLSVSFTVIEGDDDACYVLIDNTNEESYDIDLANTFSVIYSVSGSAVTEQFTVGISRVELTTPFKSVISVYDTDDQTVVYNSSNYTIAREQVNGTVIEDADDPYYESTQENAWFKFIGGDTFENGKSISFDYTYNSTLKNMKETFDLQANRIITSDLLFKEAIPIFINIGFSVKMKAGQTLDDIKVATIESSLSQYFDAMNLGSSTDESDIVAWLYRDTNVTSFVDYISLPFTSFYVPEDASTAITSTRDGTYISTTQLEYPVLNKTSFTAI
jgi:hypothetical protein